jgi:hypothetical protein
MESHAPVLVVRRKHEENDSGDEAEEITQCGGGINGERGLGADGGDLLRVCCAGGGRAAFRTILPFHLGAAS